MSLLSKIREGKHTDNPEKFHIYEAAKLGMQHKISIP
jgi:hypothetical protein